MLHVYLYVALLLSLVSQGKAAERIMPGEPLYPNLQIHVDADGRQTFEEVRTGATFKEGSPIVGFKNVSFWVRFELENPESSPQEIVLEEQWALTDFIDIYQIKPDGRLLHIERGHKAAASPGQRLHRYPYAQLILEPGVHTVYLQYRTQDIVGSRIALWQVEDFRFHQLASQLVYGLLLGALLVMSVYNLFLYFAIRIPAYLYYALYSFCFFLFQFCFSGFMSQISGQYAWWVDEGTVVFASFTMFGVVLFTQNFLQLKSYALVLYHAGWIPFALAAASFIFAFVDFQSAALAVITGNVCVASWIICCAVYATYRKIPEGRIYLLAWGVFVLGDIGTILYYIGLATPNLVTQWGMIVGSVTEVVMLSFGLANFVHRMRQEIHDTKEQLNLELAQNLSRVEAQVQSKTRDIRLILQNIQQGIFTVQGERLLVNEEHSAALLPMLGEDSVSGRRFADIFLNKLDLDADQRSQIASALVSMQGEDALNFDLNAHILPREIRFHQSIDAKRTLELNWEPVLNGSRVERILITVRDVTRDRELQAMTREQSEEIMIMSAILQGDPRLFGMFLKSSRIAIRRALELAQHKGGPPDSQSELYRILHTLKGNARTEKLQNLALMIHECEESLQKGAVGPDLLLRIETELRRYHRIFDRYFANHFSVDAISIPRNDILALNEFLKKAGFEKEAALVRSWLQKSLFALSQLQVRLKEDIARLAADLGKEPCMLHCRFENAYVNHEVFEALTDVCGHLLRNSLDHGLEAAPERMKAGKTPYGHIQINFLNGSDPCITWRDDGQGLDLQRILDKARERGLDGGRTLESMDADFCQSMLTGSGFTTRDEASLISGRGVGLDAVQHRLMTMGGRLQLRFTESRGSSPFQAFEWVLWLPRKSFRVTETLTSLHEAS